MISNLVNTYSASMTNPPKGYGLDTGLKVAAYRGALWDQFHKVLGVIELHSMINQKVIEKFGQPS